MKWTEGKVTSPAGGGPGSRSSHGVSVIGDTLYLWGGEHEASTTGLKPRQFLKALGKNLVWPSCRVSFREQFLVLRIAEHPHITTENGFQFLKN